MHTDISNPPEESIISTLYDGKPRRLFLHYCTLPTCKRPFYLPKHSNGQYCSRECSGVASRTRVTVKCSFCFTSFEKRPAQIKASKSGLLFCSRACKDHAQSILSGEAFHDMRPDHYTNGGAAYREIAFKHHPKKCNRCGYARFTPVLRVHHIDRNRKNNKPENLEILCPTCHEDEHFIAKDGLYTFKNLVDTAGVEPAIVLPCEGSAIPLGDVPKT